MSTVQENQFTKQIDLFWDSWLNNLKSVQTFQDELQQKAVQAFSYQKEMLNFSAKALNTMEEQSNKFSENWNKQVQNNVKQRKSSQDQQVSEWLNSVQDVTEKVQALSWNPSHAMLDLFIKSQNQLEAAMKKTLISQQKERAEIVKKIEELTEKMKATHKGILNPINALTPMNDPSSKD